MSCGNCGITESPGGLSVCAACNKQTYCSKVCQKRDWKKHKHECNVPECPICFERIEKINSMTTECGHIFHTSCMMKHASLNGFSCPYCRGILVEQEVEVVPGTAIPEQESAWVNESNWGWDRNENEEGQPAEGSVEYGPTDDEINATLGVVPYKPTSWEISQKLAERGLTMRHFVQAFLKDHSAYSEEEELFMRMDDELYENIEEIINDMRFNPS